MNLGSASPEPGRFDYKFWLGCFVVIVLFITWAVSRPQKPVLQNVLAPHYVLPEGCDPKDVTNAGSAFKPKSPCFSEEYRIKDSERYNFFRASGSRFYDRSYYRFYDKAVHLLCNGSGDRCQVSYIHHNVFIENDEADRK